MKRFAATGVSIVILAGCAGAQQTTLGNLQYEKLTVREEAVSAKSNIEVMKKYRQFLDDASASHPLYSSALNRLADLEMVEGDRQLFKEQEEKYAQAYEAMANGESDPGKRNYQNAIDLYENLLKTNPNDRRSDWVLYQLSRAYEQNGNLDGAVEALNRLISRYPASQYRLEAEFRLGELYYLLTEYAKAESAYLFVMKSGKQNPFYEKAQYKYSWSLFKQERYMEALESFLLALNSLPISYDAMDRLDSGALSRVESEILDDILRASNLCFSYGGGPAFVERYLGQHPVQRIEYTIVTRLAEHFVETNRIKDAADTYNIFIVRNPMHPMAPIVALARIDVYSKGDFFSNSLAARKEFVERFGVNTAFWRAQDFAGRQLVAAGLGRVLSELSEYYHARMQKTRKTSDFDEALHWYSVFVESFPGEQTAQQQFLLAELLFERGRYSDATHRYETVAYELPKGSRSAEAGYAALLSYEKNMQRANAKDRAALNDAWIKSALRFVAWYGDDSRALPIQIKAAEYLFDSQRYDEALMHAREIVTNPRKKNSKYMSAAHIIIGHVAFDQGNYIDAIRSYETVQKTGGVSARALAVVAERLALANYKVAELAKAQGNLASAATTFLKTASLSNKEEVRIKAEYDAATAYIELNQWKNAIPLLEAIRQKYPKHPLQQGVTEKLAVGYQALEQFDKAAPELVRLANVEKNPEEKKNLLWTAAEYYEQSKNSSAAADVYQSYVKLYALPLEQSVEARFRISQFYLARGDEKSRRHWLNEIVNAYTQHAAQRTERVTYLAAKSSFILAEDHFARFQRQKITLPLKKSLSQKRRLMERAIREYDQIGEFNVAEFTTASTHRVAQIYQDFGSALMSSERPRGLSKPELEEYALQLEEQAYPFEEKAIAIYETNAQRVRSGLYDEWVRKSMTSLGALMPARYGKKEQYESAFEQVF